MFARVAAPLLVLLVAASARADDRPFVYAVDAVGPEGHDVDATYAINVGASASGAVRFVDPTVGQRGIVQQLGAQVGLHPNVAVGAFGLMAATMGTQALGTGGGYVHFTVLRPQDGRRGATLGFTLMGLREFGGVFASSLFIDGGFRANGFEFVANAQIERRFSSAADPIDLLFRFGANYDVLHGSRRSLRLGVEYVGQDLEAYVEPSEAEGGAVHLVALSTTATLLDRRLHLGLAPGLVVSNGAPGFGGRLSVGYTF